ncbi:MAG: hypothetical protein H7834_06935 [Magnetococcus sp. YQC-9]
MAAGAVECIKPHPVLKVVSYVNLIATSLECVVFISEKKREGLGDSSPRVLTLTLARSSKEAFFAPFAKNVPRAAKDCGIVLRLLQNNPANMAQEQSRVTKGFKG